MILRLLVCAAMGAARLYELRLSRRNVSASGPTREGEWTRATYPLIVALHVLTIAGVALRGGRVRWPWLTVLLAVQPVRAWVLATLESRWNVRAAVPEAMPVATDGPYRWVRHPNYSVVAVELATLPLAFGLPRLAAFATAANTVLLSGRIREEEAFLAELPGWREHFEELPRFVPRLW